MIFDLHNDFLTAPFLNGLLPNQAYSSMISYAVWTTRLNDPIDFLIKAKKRGISNLAIEDLHFITDENLFVLKKVKPIYASLTWNHQNSLAGGSDTDSGLTKKGKSVIQYLNNSDIALDVAHLSRTAFYDVVMASTKPVVCSHTCLEGVFSHRRNLNDKQIKLLIQNNGLIGLTLVSCFMGKKQADLSDVINQIDYFAQRFTVDNLAIGSDFYGTDYPAINGYCAFKALHKGLINLGYKDNDIDKIFYKNAFKFFNITGENNG